MSDQYQRAKEVFLTVCDLDAPERTAALDRECGDDAELRRDVESLLTHHESSQDTSVVSSRRTPDESSGETSVVSSRATEPSAFVAPEPDVPGALPARIGSYRVVREIARGGMGVVYLGEDERFKRRVAIKVVKRGMDTDSVLRRFDLERQLLAALTHPGICRLYDGGETDDGRPYFVMEYVTGMPIDDYCDTHRLTIAERMKLFKDVCLIVHHAHQNLVVHRDLKPSNILVGEDGSTKLLDFGIAKLLNPDLSMGGGDLTAPESRVMTPEYASPEQVRGHPLTTSSDVYSLGVLLYELVSGHRPYRIGSRARAEVERVVCGEEPEKPSTAISRVDDDEMREDPTSGVVATVTPESVSRVREGRPERLRRRLAGDIDNIVLMAMRKAPQRRYASAEQMADDIQRHLDGLPVAARPDSFGYRTSKFISRHRFGVAAAAFISISLVGGIFGTTWQAQVAATQRNTAARRFDLVRSLARTFMFDFHDAIVTLDGSIPARELLVTTAQKYLDDLREEVGDHSGLLRELAFAYERVGDIRGGIRNPSLGDTEGALANYRTAFDLRRDLITALQDPPEPEFEGERAASHMKMGDALLHSGQVDEGRKHYQESLTIAEALAKSDPEYRGEFAVALGNVGAALRRVGMLREAKGYYERSLEIRKALAARDPFDRVLKRRVSVMEIRVGSVLAKMGDHEAGLEHYRRALEIRDRIADDAPDSRARRDQAMAHNFVAEAHLALGRPQAAQDHLNRFLEIAEHRLTENPSDARAQRDLSMAHEIIGRTSAMVGDLEQARAHYERAQEEITDLSEFDPVNTSYRRRVAESHERFGELGLAEDDTSAALDSFTDALEIIEELAFADPDDVGFSEDRARLLSKLGEVYRLRGNLVEAEAKLSAARQLYEDFSETQPENAELRNEFADTLAELALVMVASRQGDPALGYANRALAANVKRRPRLLRSLAAALFLAGDAEGAIEAATEALGGLDRGLDPDRALQLGPALEADLERYR